MPFLRRFSPPAMPAWVFWEVGLPGCKCHLLAFLFTILGVWRVGSGSPFMPGCLRVLGGYHLGSTISGTCHRSSRLPVLGTVGGILFWVRLWVISCLPAILGYYLDACLGAAACLPGAASLPMGGWVPDADACLRYPPRAACRLPACRACRSPCVLPAALDCLPRLPATCRIGTLECLPPGIYHAVAACLCRCLDLAPAAACLQACLPCLLSLGLPGMPASSRSGSLVLTWEFSCTCLDLPAQQRMGLWEDLLFPHWSRHLPATSLPAVTCAACLLPACLEFWSASGWSCWMPGCTACLPAAGSAAGLGPPPVPPAALPTQVPACCLLMGWDCLLPCLSGRLTWFPACSGLTYLPPAGCLPLQECLPACWGHHRWACWDTCIPPATCAATADPACLPAWSACLPPGPGLGGRPLGPPACRLPACLPLGGAPCLPCLPFLGPTTTCTCRLVPPPPGCHYLERPGCSTWASWAWDGLPVLGYWEFWEVLLGGLPFSMAVHHSLFSGHHGCSALFWGGGWVGLPGWPPPLPALVPAIQIPPPLPFTTVPPPATTTVVSTIACHLGYHHLTTWEYLPLRVPPATIPPPGWVGGAGDTVLCIWGDACLGGGFTIFCRSYRRSIISPVGYLMPLVLPAFYYR